MTAAEAGPSPVTWATRWVVAAAAMTFAGCFVLTVYCDFFRPVAPGVDYELRPDGLHVNMVEAGTPAAQAGLQAGDLILVWNGRDTHDIDLRLIEGHLELGAPMALVVDRAGTRLDLALLLPRAPWSYWRSRQGWMLLIARVVQLTSLALAVVVVIRGRGDATTYVGAWALATFSAFSVVPPYRLPAVWGGLPWPVGALLWPPYLSGLSIAAVLATFLAIFPHRTVGTKVIWSAIWIPMGLALIQPTVYLLRLVYAPDTAHANTYHGRPLLVVSGGYLIWGTAVLARRYRRTEDVTERRRVRVLVGGLLLGVLGGGWVIPVYYLAPGHLGDSLFKSPSMAAGTLLLLAIPLAFTYAILKHRLFDVRIMIRQGVRYALARRSVQWVVPGFVLALVLELAVRHASQDLWSVFETHAIAYAFVGGLLLTVRWQRGRWLEAIDRRFFRDRYDGQRLLRRVADDLHEASDLESVAPRLVGQLESAFHAEFAAVLVRARGASAFVPLASAPMGRAPGPIDAGSKLVALVTVLGQPVEVGLPDVRWLSRRLPLSEVELLHAQRIELIAPVGPAGSMPEALLCLGPKRSEEPYTDDDIELVTAVSRNLALAVGGQPRSADPGRTLEECPECHTCHPAGTERCPDDGRPLVTVATPQVIAGRYRLRSRLGEGGMGAVFRAVDEALERPVAVKLIREALALQGEAARRFHQEARIAASLVHPNIVTVHDFGEVNGGPYLVMELLDGITLRDELRRRSPLPTARALGILRGVCAAVAIAHRRHLVHRDLKPENIFLTGSPDRIVPKVLDFGIAKARLTAEGQPTPVATDPGQLVGTPHYMAPEQLRGEAAGPAADLWAVSVIAFEMLTGIHPVGDLPGTASDAARELPGVHDTIVDVEMPEAWRAVFHRGLALDPFARPESADDLYAELERALGSS